MEFLTCDGCEMNTTSNYDENLWVSSVKTPFFVLSFLDFIFLVVRVLIFPGLRRCAISSITWPLKQLPVLSPHCI